MSRGDRFMRLAPWLVFLPGLAIMLTTMVFNLLGDGLRMALDSRQRSGES